MDYLNGDFWFPENFQAYARALAVPYALLVPRYVRKLSYLYQLSSICCNVRIIYTKPSPLRSIYHPSHVITRNCTLDVVMLSHTGGAINSSLRRAKWRSVVLEVSRALQNSATCLILYVISVLFILHCYVMFIFCFAFVHCLC